MNVENLQPRVDVDKSDKLARQTKEAAENNQRLIQEARDTVKAADRFTGMIRAELKRLGKNATEVEEGTALDLIEKFEKQKAEAEGFLVKVGPKPMDVEQENIE